MDTEVVHDSRGCRVRKPGMRIDEARMAISFAFQSLRGFTQPSERAGCATIDVDIDPFASIVWFSPDVGLEYSAQRSG